MRRGGEKNYQHQTTHRYWMTYINPFFIIGGVVMMVVFSVYATVYQFVFSDNKIDLFAQNLKDIALYVSPFDPEVSKNVLDIDNIATAYLSGENILLTKRKLIHDLVVYIRVHKQYLTTLGFSRYQGLLNIISDILAYEEELNTLLGAYSPQHYLVILQNVGEKRPNGGFFGSFAFITVEEARITDVDIIDTYFPNAIAPNAYINTPERSHNIMSPKMGFLSSNRFGFTSIDGANIKTLYEKAFGGGYDPIRRKTFFNAERYKKLFHQKIAGVLFIRSDILTFLLPGFEQKLRERQFINASIDLIRGVTITNKKEIYIKEVNEYFYRYKGQIFMNLVKNFDTIRDRNYIQAYIPNASTGLEQLIIKQGFSNVPQPNTLYARDNNASFNKSDTFITKTISVITPDGETIRETNQDIVRLPQEIMSRRSSKPLTLTIRYDLNVPESYTTFIEQLAHTYQIEITSRERSILVLEPVIWVESKHPMLRKTDAHIYYPKNWSLLPRQKNLTGFEAPFAKGRRYQSIIRSNNTSVSQIFDLKLTQ